MIIQSQIRKQTLKHHETQSGKMTKMQKLYLLATLSGSDVSSLVSFFSDFLHKNIQESAIREEAETLSRAISETSVSEPTADVQ